MDLALCLVFVLMGAFYVWTAGTSYSLSLTGAHSDPYNQLANAFIHMRLWVGHAPAALLKLSNPYNPEQNLPLQEGIHDYTLYHGKLFLAWGPAPVIVLLVPLHLLGLEPSSSVTTSLFAIAGLGFVLAILRLVLRQIGDVPLWMCVLAALTLALASSVPIMLRRPAIYEEEIAAGYCFVMAGLWLALSAVAERRGTLLRVAIMSLCFGLAIGSRPTLVFAAIVLVPVYLSLRSLLPRRGLLMALLIPVGICGVLLLLYNQVRFGGLLQNGAKYQLTGNDQPIAPFNSFSYIPPGLWFYWLSLPEISALFPFLEITSSPVFYPGKLSALYAHQLEMTGGLLPMAPIVVFLAALPWIWRRRARALGPLGMPLLLLAGAGAACVLFLVYVFFSTTERYEVDFTTLFLLGAVASWLVLSMHARGWRRQLARVGGGLLAAWSCIAGLAISFTGYSDLLAVTHPGTWSTLEDIASPLSRALVTLKGQPVLSEAFTLRKEVPSPQFRPPPQYPLLSIGRQAHITIVSPDATQATLLAHIFPFSEADDGQVTLGDFSSALLVRGLGLHTTFIVPPRGGKLVLQAHLNSGLNRLTLTSLSNRVTSAASTSHLGLYFISPGCPPGSIDCLGLGPVALSSASEPSITGATSR